MSKEYKHFVFSVVELASFSGVVPSSEATNSAIILTFAGVLIVPRTGSGDKYGLSVSKRSLFKGTNIDISLSMEADLKVIFPAKLK